METTPNDIQRLWYEMEAQGYDLTVPRKWGHFFFDPDLDSLWNLLQELRSRGYQFESCHRAADGEYVLQVYKVEVRTLQQLQTEDETFRNLAEDSGIQMYDGWDVGDFEDEEQADDGVDA